jgi:hypothetical protein
MTSENEYKRAVKIIEESLLIDTGQRVRSIDAVDSRGQTTRLWGPSNGKTRGYVNTNVSTETGKPTLVCVITWLGIGIFCGLFLAGIIYILTV